MKMPSKTLLLFIYMFIFQKDGIFCLDKEYIEEHSDGRLPCKHSIPRDELHRVFWFKSSRDDVFEYDDPALLSWDGISQFLFIDNYGIDTDLSLVIHNTSIKEEGIYRCYLIMLTSNVRVRSSYYDVKMISYALPRKMPSIQHFFQTGIFFINCSVDNVYPLLFPKLNFVNNSQTYGIRNEDGTHNTSISGNVVHNGQNITVECTFPHFNYTGKSSYSIPPPADCSASTCPNHFASTTGIVFGTLLPTTFVILFVVFVWQKLTKNHQQSDVDKSPPEIESMV